MPVARRLRIRIPGSRVYIWVDAMCAVVAALAPAAGFFRRWAPRSLARMGPVAGTDTAGLVAGITQSVRLRRHNRAASRASLRTTP